MATAASSDATADGAIRLGDRIVTVKSGKVGVCRYIGQLGSTKGEWLGMELDAPEGRHDGEHKGRQGVARQSAAGQ
ncbi:hypothetical protein FNF27_04427 [Cafeteria roenbergensis]|uniref:CAP-Gly domain-containing protein n=1 Tax=Cafeteria roenbergensis TaxID=33653 RepID=A0A5A8EDN9_CAFRO|nr:hypothetical protein FNF28_06003 [Cafeteria roenbergensis]KAA0174041.1 hypothetical protein FNF27_04427 [Cafeteria roenbergensis]